MGYYAIREIYPWLYSIRDPQDSAYCYLAVGGERALLFDTAHGIGNLPDAVREVTNKPVTVALGHGHLDHVGGACQFGEAWLHEADFDLCRRHASEKARSRLLDRFVSDGHALPEGFERDAYICAGAGSLKKMEPGQIFDLGGLRMEAVGMEGHTAGSVGLLALERRVLLNSDSANAHVWMFLRESLSISQYVAMLERVIQLDFDVFFIGHCDGPKPKSDFEKYINAARNASAEKSRPYPVLPEFGGQLYEENGAAIIFHKDKL